MTSTPQLHTKAHHDPSIGLCLSGGGARGLAHIGVLRILEREGIPIDYLAGTSMGGLIAAGYAAGLSTAELEEIALEATQKKRLLRMADPGIPNGGLIRGQQMLAFFTQIFGEKTFADLNSPLAVVAVDLNSHREIILNDGKVAQALRATTSIPGLFMPVETDGQRLVDGGVLNNLPVDVTRNMGADTVIAVDVGFNHEGGVGQWFTNRAWIPNAVSTVVEVIDDTLFALMAANQESKLIQFPPDILVHPELSETITTVSGYERVPELIAAGERATEKCLPQIMDFLE